MSKTVPVNEDHLFEVKVFYRTLSPVYWEGPTYPVRRATWFMQADGSKWTPCEEVLAQQIEAGYRKYKPYNDAGLLSVKRSEASTTTLEEEKLQLALASQPVEKQWNLLGPYLGQYVAYTGPQSAWLLSNSTSSKLAKSIITRLTNKQNLGGTRLVRGYQATVDRHLRGSKSSPTLSSLRKADREQDTSVDDAICLDEQMTEQSHVEIQGSEDEGIRPIDHIVFVVPGAGQRFVGQNFVNDVDNLRKAVKSVFPAVMAGEKSNGIQFLPVPWRHEIKFGISREEGQQQTEADLGEPDGDDGCPTLDELTVDGVPNIRSIVSDVIIDIPLYLTPKYREQMTTAICMLINDIFLRYVTRNPDFLERDGKVSIIGHSLGALVAFDMLALQPKTPPPTRDELAAAIHQPALLKSLKKMNTLLFKTENFFGLGSPAGLMLLVKGTRIVPRKARGYQGRLSSQCYFPAVNNLYNIFHKLDPIAYRLEPLISRQFGSTIKPATIPHIKDLVLNKAKGKRASGSGGITNRAGAMYESIKYGLTANLVMRSLGLSTQQIYEDLQSSNSSDSEENAHEHQATTAVSDSGKATSGIAAATSAAADVSLTNGFISNRHARSSSDSAVLVSAWNHGVNSTRQGPPVPVIVAPDTSRYSDGARRLQALNVTGRVDYCLQENTVDNAYWGAIATHLAYWKDVDVAAFLAREIYRQS
ncbi:DDHD domain-containing protein [Dichotomocladium elegans]|nr:DDHD domain-containing protein [Dichotomocladium elegans]